MGVACINIVVFLASQARRSLRAELAGRKRERLVTNVNIPQRLCRDSGKTTSELSVVCGKLPPIIMICRAVRVRRMEADMR